MKGKTWLWVGLGALGLVFTCCIGVMIGGTLSRQAGPATQATLAVAAQPTAEVATPPPAELPIEPTLPPPTPTQAPVAPTPVPPTPTQAPTQAPPPPPPTLTPFPPPPPPAAPPSAPPASAELQALVDYANAMQPLLAEASVLVERDGDILEASEGGNDVVLCDGRLAADNAAMANILERVRRVSPPPDAVAIHDLVQRAGDSWTEALDNVAQFCATGNHLYKLPAVLKFWESALTLQDAWNRFWLLLVAQGVEDWVQR